MSLYDNIHPLYHLVFVVFKQRIPNFELLSKRILKLSNFGVFLDIQATNLISMYHDLTDVYIGEVVLLKNKLLSRFRHILVHQEFYVYKTRIGSINYYLKILLNLEFK